MLLATVGLWAGRVGRGLAWLLSVVCVSGATLHARAASDTPPDVQFALLRYQGNWNPRPHGLVRLAWEIRRRTSIHMALDAAAVDAAEEAVFQYPLLVWQGDADFPPLPDAAIFNLRQHVAMGGTLFIDVSDGVENGAFHRAVVRELQRVFPQRHLDRIPPEHVFYKAYYLLDRHGGRVPSRAYLEGIAVEDRLAVILTTNDQAGAMARDPFGEWEYDVGPGGESSREMSFRLGVNLVMYALCLDYKEDQVHIRYLLERRR